MRFDKRIGLITLENISDGLGGHTEAEKVICVKYANVEELSLETTVKIYGDAHTKSVKVAILGSAPKIDLIDIDNVKYKVVSQKKTRNKTSFLLELIDND
ncbi:MAG: hypothetical protein ACRC18_04365 [Cetobacterium sp.]